MTQKSKPRIFSSDLSQLPIALQWLTKQRRWVVWRWVARTSKSGKVKWTKPPYQPAFPNAPAKSNDPSTWGSYEEALAVVAAGKADGIGVMLLEGELAAADLDHCRDPATGKLSGWAMRLCVEADQLGLYREVTVSGCGLRFIGLSHQGAELHRRFPFHQDQRRGARAVPQLRPLHHDLWLAGGSMRDHGRDRRLSGRAAGALCRATGSIAVGYAARSQHRRPAADGLLSRDPRERRQRRRAQRAVCGSGLAPGRRRNVDRGDCRRARQASERHRRQVCEAPARRGDALFQQVENPPLDRRHRNGGSGGICNWTPLGSRSPPAP